MDDDELHPEPPLAATIDAAHAEDFARQVLERAGCGTEQAADAAAALLYASLRGVDTHGLRNLKRYYVDGLQAGRINGAAVFRIDHQTPVSMRVDADQGLGMAASAWAMKQAIGMAQQSGIGLVAVHNSTHFGAAGAYTQLAVDAGMIGVSMTGAVFAGGRHRGVVPSAGTLGILSTNPISFGFPSDKTPPFLLDMATSVVPVNRVEMLAGEGAPRIPDGWAVNKGIPSSDPNVFDAVLPLGGQKLSTGGHKGTGLALMVAGLTGVLSGAWQLHELGEPASLDLHSDEQDEEEEAARVNGSAASTGFLTAPSGGEPEAAGGGSKYDQRSDAHFFGAIRVDLFQPLDQFRAAIDAMNTTVATTPPRTGVERVLYPGLLEHEEMLKRQGAAGIPLPQVVVDDFRVMAEELGLDLHLQPPPPLANAKL